MSRRNKQYDIGILTTTECAKFSCISSPTIRRLIELDQIPGSYTLPYSKERRVPAPSLAYFLYMRDMPIPSDLVTLVAIYMKHHEYWPTGIKGFNLSAGKITVTKQVETPEPPTTPLPTEATV